MNSGSEVIVHTADGTAGSGKGTVGRKLNSVGYLDTGQGYRAVTEWFLRANEIGSEDPERAQALAEVFASDPDRVNEFAGTLPERVQFGVDGVFIDGVRIGDDEIQRILYADTINTIISSIARQESIRNFCGGISVRFIKDAKEKGVNEVFLDGRTERQVLIRAFRAGAIKPSDAKLGLPAFFTVDPIEAAHRTLVRDNGVEYRSLSDDHPDVIAKAEIAKRRNERDSDPTNVDPMLLTEEHYDAWAHALDGYISPLTVQKVVGAAPDGSGSRHVLFDTTNRPIEQVVNTYEAWRENILRGLK